MLDKTASKRLGILVRNAAAKGKPATDQQIAQWTKALQDKQWIPGTPWNGIYLNFIINILLPISTT